MEGDFTLGIKWYLVFLFSTVCHEAAHAWSAWKLGDDTAQRGGQVTLDPTPHIKREPVGMVLVPILAYLSSGWMIGWASAPYSVAWARQFPGRAALMALAGPAANLLLVLFAVLCIRFGTCQGWFEAPFSPGFSSVTTAVGSGLGSFFAAMLSLCFSLNLLLALFNLLPLPPLDGSSLPLLFLRGGLANGYQSAIQNPGWFWIGLFLAWKLFDGLFQPFFRAACRILLP